MAREEHPKEDLIGQAVGLTNRAEYQIEGFEEPVVIGFRSTKAASLFFGEEPVYHWNEAGALRRAYVDGKLIKAERRQLVSLSKRRDDGKVQMIRHELSGEEQDAFLMELQARLNRMLAAFEAGGVALMREVSAPGFQMSKSVVGWLAEQPPRPKIAAKPNV